MKTVRFYLGSFVRAENISFGLKDLYLPFFKGEISRIISTDFFERETL